MGSLYPGRVMRIDPGGPLVRVPLLGRDALWGPVVTVVGGLAAGEQVLVGQLGATRDQLVILGRLDPDGLANANSRLVALETLVGNNDVRLLSVETGIAALTRSDGATALALRNARERLSAIENAATALPALIDTTAGTSAGLAQVILDVSALRADLTTTQANVSTLDANVASALQRIGELEAWRGEGGGGSTPPPAPTAPGALLSMRYWELTLPIGGDGGDPANPVDIYYGGSPDLASYVHADYFRVGSDSNGYYVEFVSPVTGAGMATTSSAAGATRSELREMVGTGASGEKAAWELNDGVLHELVVTMTVDPTSIVNGRKEMLIGQFHAAGGTPPLYLAANFNSTPGKVTLFKNGPSVADILTGLTVGTKFTYRIAKTAAGRVQVSIATGDAANLPGTPQYDWPSSDFTATDCYFKVGAYNKTTLDDPDATGAARTRVYMISLNGSASGGSAPALEFSSGQLDTVLAVTDAAYDGGQKSTRTLYLTTGVTSPSGATITKVVALTQASFDALGTKAADTFYLITTAPATITTVTVLTAAAYDALPSKSSGTAYLLTG